MCGVWFVEAWGGGRRIRYIYVSEHEAGFVMLEKRT